jgi:hypothetical protein
MSQTPANASEVMIINGQEFYFSLNSPLPINPPPSVINGSGSGSATFAQTRIGNALMQVLIYTNALTGTATYNFPFAFNNLPVVHATNGPAAAVVTSISKTSITVTGTATSGHLLISGS